jgi:hypothetical protein
VAAELVAVIVPVPAVTPPPSTRTTTIAVFIAMPRRLKSINSLGN